MLRTYLSTIWCFLLLVSCKDKSSPINVTAENYYTIVDKVTETMVFDIFSPPVASRIYTYPNIAAYEIIAKKNKTYKSLVGQLDGLTTIPANTDENVDLEVAAIIAYIESSKKLVFTKDFVNHYQDSIYHSWSSTNKNVFNASKAYGEDVAKHIIAWANTDNYIQTRTMPSFAVKIDDINRWQPTPPNYMDGIEPHWNKIRPLTLASANQFKPKTHPEFSLEKGSEFYKELIEVYDVTSSIKSKGDHAEEVKIAQFWDCNPYVAVSTGHLVTATKKITPGGHWISIAKIASKKNNLDLNEALYVQTLTSIGIFDAFISCWDEKYRSNLVRPETLINKEIDKDWMPLLQTPPFPEYTSGHSVVSGAASVILTHIFKDDFSFIDNSEVKYGLPIRKFTSFKQAAEEAAISRLYGGIHYRAAIDNGLNQGLEVGHHVLNKLDLKQSK